MKLYKISVKGSKKLNHVRTVPAGVPNAQAVSLYLLVEQLLHHIKHR